MLTLREAAKNIQGGSLNLAVFYRRDLAPLDILQSPFTPTKMTLNPLNPPIFQIIFFKTPLKYVG